MYGLSYFSMSKDIPIDLLILLLVSHALIFFEMMKIFQDRIMA